VVTRLTGQERLSAPFRFRVELLARSTAELQRLDPRALLREPARVGFREEVHTGGGEATRVHWIEGVLDDFVQRSEEEGWLRFEATLVPRLALLARTWRSRVLLDLDLAGLVRALLRGAEMEEDEDWELASSIRDAVAAGAEPRERPRYPEREAIVQYEESDLAFLSRWLEHEGAFYAFENSSQRERVLFGDSVGRYRELPGESSTLAFRPQGMQGTPVRGQRPEPVRSFEVATRPLPREVVLADYNWRTPELTQLVCREAVDPQGRGVQREYNDHFKDFAQGQALARVRAEELRAGEVLAQGTSECLALRPGLTFRLAEHPREAWNRGWLVTAVEHEVEQSFSLQYGSVLGARYVNTFRAIPDDRAFRPARTTPWPVIHGVMHAKVDASPGSEPYADVDELGRYLVRIPFDEDLEGRGRASRYVRMAQPYAGGDGSGMHFPLRKGTEVLLSHVDGDPDRPIIVGAVPNPSTQSPVTEANRHQNALQTPTGNQLIMDDQEGNQGIQLVTSSRNLVLNYRSIDRPAERTSGGSS
jgi:type VI secretion system secreted protein VgrG